MSVRRRALELLEQHLGTGDAKQGEIVWRVTEFGRHCLVYLHTWSSGVDTVTTLDTARPSSAIVKNIELDGYAGLGELERELRVLTTHMPPS